MISEVEHGLKYAAFSSKLQPGHFGHTGRNHTGFAHHRVVGEAARLQLGIPADEQRWPRQ
ncbi:hypothetical protein METUNv1_02561 [Methyloversatilis universalis FAM5]|uniref:Uncharacterized protein n=1 Tax=Methyloversatilis universalis (strain ATCC BAA-1314 / DSM 25237 / JCM 13912 / CCUG 52030 / FAM5) TaxID=1000565 RepID=F5RE43_METUF|nr:hypothetical protein METUNv1_02561 [Methyloversatilis universalis FAM5]